MNTNIRKYIEVESMIDSKDAVFSIDDTGDLKIDFAHWKSHYVPAKELLRLTKFLMNNQTGNFKKFSTEERAWQKAVQACELFNEE